MWTGTDQEFVERLRQLVDEADRRDGYLWGREFDWHDEALLEYIADNYVERRQPDITSVVDVP